jgi:predicted nuclease of predicted toxin-antitoxin system
VKLLFDQNLSPRLAQAFSAEFPGTAHVREVDLERAQDDLVWSFADRNGFTIVTKDSDFHELGLVRGFPPKVVWIRRGNCSTDEIESILRSSVAQVHRLEGDPEAGFLVLPSDEA